MNTKFTFRLLSVNGPDKDSFSFRTLLWTWTYTVDIVVVTHAKQNTHMSNIRDTMHWATLWFKIQLGRFIIVASTSPRHMPVLGNVHPIKILIFFRDVISLLARVFIFLIDRATKEVQRHATSETTGYSCVVTNPDGTGVGTYFLNAALAARPVDSVVTDHRG